MEILTTPEFGQFMANLIMALIAVAIPVIGAAVRNLLARMKGSKEFETAYQLINMAVLAAEQAGMSGAIENKKDYALAVAQDLLNDRGIKMDLSAIDAAVEAAVANELNRGLINDINYQKSVSGGSAA